MKHKVGTLSPGPVMIGLAGTELRSDEVPLLRHPWVGGVTLFSRNYSDPRQLQKLCTDIRQARGGALLIAVDHEGGRVQRFREGFTRLPPLAVHGELYDHDPQRALDDAYRHGRVTAGELLAMGIDLAFAPVLDVLGRSEVIGDRAFGRTKKLVKDLGEALIAGLHDGGMAAVGKHFPGHGSVAADSHTSVVIDERPLHALEEDMAPFQALAGQLDAVMMAHVCYSQVDARPAGYSPCWVKQQLRQRMGFAGVVISDDLGMMGGAGVGDLLRRLQAAMNAGCDLALVCAVDESLELLSHLNGVAQAPDASLAVEALQGRERPDLTEYARVPEWRQWQQRLSELACV